MSAFVYTFRAADGTALYVGYTYHPKSRIQDHHRKPWWPVVADVQVIEYPDWRDAKATERSTIEALQPIHNIVFTERWQYAPRRVAACPRAAGGGGDDRRRRDRPQRLDVRPPGLPV